MTTLAHRPAHELAQMIRAGSISSVELLDHFLERTDRLNAAINAIVTFDRDGARTRAKHADDALACGESWGPLHGVPMTIKDCFETAAIRTTAGAPELVEHVPARNAVAVERLCGAGAIVFGKTNVPYMAADVQTFNDVFGITNNPWNLSRTCGGSSGGAAAAVAAGLTAIELGSDIGGSIRTPSNWCGVYGHKVTHGLIPVLGHIPGPPGSLAEADLNVAGPIARHAADLAVALDVLAGPRADRAIAWRLHLPKPRHERLQPYRVGVCFDDPAFPVDAQVRNVLEHTAKALEQAGVRVYREPLPFALEELADTYFQLLFPIIAAGFPPHVFESLSSGAAALPADDRGAFARLARYGTARFRDWAVANEKREHYRAQLAELFQHIDVLLCPVTSVAAIAHDHAQPMTVRNIEVNGAPRSYQDLFGWISIATLGWLPATVAPVGLTENHLPVGVQIIGPYLEDRTTIDFAQRLAEVVPGVGTPPGY